MRNIYIIFLTVLLTCPIVLLPLTSESQAAPSGPRIYLDPSDNVFYSNVTSVGHCFNVTVWVEDAPELGGANVKLEFNDSIVNVTRWWAPSWDSNFFMPDPYKALPSPPDPGYIHVGPGDGYVKVAVSKAGYPPEAPWGHNGTVCIFEFKITALPPEGGQLSCALHINTTGTFLLDPVADEVPGVVKEDGTYTFNYVAAPYLPHIWLEASPATYEAIKLRPFNVSVIIQNVSQTDGLIGIQLIVGYNSTCLEVTEVVSGDFINKSIWAPNNAKLIHYVDERGVICGQMILPNATGQWNPPFPEGNGTVITITFLPLLHKETNFNITINPLFGWFFLDKEGEEIPYLSAKSCQYTYSPLPVPVLGITPSRHIASHVGETFDINVTLDNLDVLWKMNYTEFKFWCNNSSYLQVLNVTEGDFLSQFGNTTFNQEVDGYIAMNITLTSGTYPFGSGTLATITFNVTSCPGSCKLLLSDTKLLDFKMEEVLHEVQHGYYELHEMLVHPIVWNAETYYVVTVSNSCVTPVPMSFYQLHMMLSFNVTGINGTVGFVNITIPRALLYSSPTNWIVIVGGKAVEVTVVENTTYASLYFTFNSSSKTVYILGTEVIPEMTPNVFMLVLLAATIIGLAIAKTRLKKREEIIHCKTPPTRL